MKLINPHKTELGCDIFLGIMKYIVYI